MVAPDTSLDRPLRRLELRRFRAFAPVLLGVSSCLGLAHLALSAVFGSEPGWLTATVAVDWKYYQLFGKQVAGAEWQSTERRAEAPARFEWTPLYFKEIELIGSNAFGFEDFEGRRRHAMEIYFDLIRSGRLDLTPIVTHRFALESYREAFGACWDQGASGAVKVLFDYAPDERSGSARRSPG